MAGRGGRKKTQPDGTGGQVPAPPTLLLLPARAAGGPSCSPPILPPAPLREVPASTTVPPRPRPGQAPAPLPRLQTPAGRCQRCRARTRRASSVYPPWSTHCRQASQTPCQSAWPGSSRSWSWRASPAGGAAGSGVRRIGVTGRWEDAVSPITSTTYCTTHSRVILPRLRRPPAIRSGCSGGGHTGGRQRRPSGGAYSQRRGLLLAILAACRRPWQPRRAPKPRCQHAPLTAPVLAGVLEGVGGAATHDTRAGHRPATPPGVRRAWRCICMAGGRR